MRITQQQLESYLWGAATLLRGTIDAGDYKQFIFPLLFFKRLCDVYDEETLAALAESGGDAAFASFSENHRFQVPAEAHWRAVRQVARDVGQALQSALRAVETANPDKLYGIFGDAQWTNKERLTDAMLRDLIEHFSSLELSIANLPEDALGQGYEYLIKKFADDSGHTAAEFYTNRTVVHLMTELLEPQPGETIYDPTCGSGGMLLSCIAHLRRQGKEWRNVRLYGQERNLMTSAIARMNCFLHGIEEFRIERGDTLAAPRFVHGDRLQRFDVVLANPPYSIKQWDRDAFAADPWGRNVYGTPPQGRADYAFWQHILASLDPERGRCAILFPHGVLFRQEEAEMRRKMLEDDCVECVLGLGPNLFYNSPMEACVVVCRAKPRERRGKVLFVNAVGEVARERAQSLLTDEHIARIAGAYRAFADEEGFARVVDMDKIRARGHNLSIALYVMPNGAATARPQGGDSLGVALDGWLTSRRTVAEALRPILPDTASLATDVSLKGLDTCALFDRSGWTSVRLGDLVENLNESERDPAEAGIERFIGLEHLEPGSLHVRSWGNVADGTTFTRRCRPGQTLFGKRRAYQRKVAVAEFDAVVSGDIYVLAPKDERLLPELLPFICLSERFYQHAVETSAGSLSPRTNWSHLAQFEFALPPLEQQRRIAQILWAADETAERYADMRASTVQLRDAIVSDFLTSHAWHSTRLGEHLDMVQYGTSQRCSLQPLPGHLPVLRIPNVITGKIDPGDLVWLKKGSENERYRLAPGDVLIVRTNGNPDYVGRSAVFGDVSGQEYLFASYLIRLRCRDDDLSPKFLHEVLESHPLRRAIRKQAKSSAGNYNINTQGIRGLEIPLPPLSDQEAFIRRIESLDDMIMETDTLVSALRTASRALATAIAEG